MLRNKNQDEISDTGGQVRPENEDRQLSEETDSGNIGIPNESYENIKPKQTSTYPTVTITTFPPFFFLPLFPLPEVTPP